MAKPTINMNVEDVRRCIHSVRVIADRITFSTHKIKKNTATAGEIWADDVFNRISFSINEIVKIVNDYNDKIEKLMSGISDVAEHVESYLNKTSKLKH